MPNAFMSLDSGFPAFTGAESTEEKLASIHNYLFMLLEHLRYILRNLGMDNFNAAELQKLEEAVADTLEVETLISDTVITGELYADYGAMAALTVWKLRTDWLRAQRYLRGDTSQLDYISIHGEQMDFITAVTDGSRRVQLEADGRRFYWEDEGCSRMSCLRETEWPVYVYVYQELTKMSLRFQNIPLENGEETVMPVLQLGAGDERGNSRAWLYKDAAGICLRYVTSAGKTLSLRMDDSGFVNILRQRRPLCYDFSRLEGGCFVETLEGGDSFTYRLETDSAGNITRILHPDGLETEVCW